MAYLQQPQTEEEKKRDEQLRAASGMPGGAAGALPAGGQPSPTSGASGNFTNLQRYLEENRSQAGDLANKVAGQVTAAGEEAKTAAEGLAAKGKEAIEGARVPTNMAVLDEAAANPAGIVADEAKKTAFAGQRDAAYQGPTSLEDVEGFQDAQDKVRKAQERVGLTDTEAGRTTLLQEMGGPGYGRGKATLNQLLLSGDPDAAARLRAAAEPYRGLQDYLGAQNDEARAAAASAVEEAAATRKGVQDRFRGPGGVVEQTTADLMAKLEAAKTGGAAAAQAATEALARWEPTDQDLATLGMTRADYDNIKGYGDISGGHVTLDPQAYLTTLSPDAELTAANVATADDYAREAALEELLGVNLPTLNPEEIGLAGTAPMSLLRFDTPGAKAGAKTALTSWMSQDIPGARALLGAAPHVAQKLRAGTSLGAIAGADFYSALDALGYLKAVAESGGRSPYLTGNEAAQWQTVKPVVDTPLFQALYKAAQEARAAQRPGTQPDALMNHLPPELRAMLT